MNRALALALELVELTLQALGLALLTLPAFALGIGSADVGQWPDAGRQAVPVMAAAYFLGLGLLELAGHFAGPPRC